MIVGIPAYRPKSNYVYIYQQQGLYWNLRYRFG